MALTWGKSAQRRRKHCALAVVRRSQKISPPPQARGRGTAKIQSAGEGHYLHLQTQFGEDRCTQFRDIVVTDPPTTNMYTTHRQDRLQYTAPIECLHADVGAVPNYSSYRLIVPSHPLLLIKDYCLQTEGAPSFSISIFPWLPMTEKKWKSMTYRHNI